MKKEQPPEGRLTLTRMEGEKIVIGDNIVITVCHILGRGRVRIGIEAPEHIKIYRQETLLEQGKK